MSEDVEKLKARIAELENQLVEEKEELEWDLKAVKESSDKTIQKLQDEIARLKKEGGGSAGPSGEAKSDDVKMLTQRALMAERRVAELQEEMKRSRNLTPAPVSKGTDPLLRQRAETAETERDELLREKRALERSLEEKDNTLERTKKELEESKKLKKQLESLKKQSSSQEKELRQLREGSGDAVKLQDEIESLKAQLAEKEDEQANLFADSKHNERQIGELNRQIEKLGKAAEERDQLAARHQESLDKVAQLESSLEKLRSEQAEQASVQDTEMENRAQEAEREVERLKQELAQVKVASGQMVEQREREAERLKSDLMDVTSQAVEKENLEREANRLRDELAGVTGERDQLATQLRLLRDDHETQVRPAPEPESDPFIVATEPAAHPRGAEETSGIPPEAELQEAGETASSDPGQETRRVRFADGVTEQTDALPSPLEGAPEEGQLPPPAVDSIEDERMPTKVAQPPQAPPTGETVTREDSVVTDSRSPDSGLPMAEPVKVGKGRSRGGLLLKAGLFGILGGLLIAAALYFFPRWFGPGGDTGTDDIDPVADTPDEGAGDDVEDSPAEDQPAPDDQPVAEGAGSPAGAESPEEADPDEMASDSPAEDPEPPPERAAEPDPRLKKAQALGLKLIKKKRYKKALRLTRKWVDKAPGDPTMRYLHGRALYYRRKRKAAAAQLEKAVELDPDMHEAYYELGGVYIRLGQTANACACLKTYLKLRPRGRRAKGVRGVIRKLKCAK